jgi:Histone methylation protein DOT1
LPADPSDQKSVDSNRVAALSRNQNVPRRHAARAHGGGALARLQDASRRVALLRPASRLAEHLLDKYSDYRARAFDRRYGIDTFERVELQHLDIPELDPRFGRWLYGPINPDFFEEMMSAIRVPFAETTFCDVGSGKGLAVLLAGSWGFKRLWGVEFSAALIERAKINASLYESKSGRRLDAEWTCGDFMQLELPPEPTLFFLNARLATWRHRSSGIRADPGSCGGSQGGISQRGSMRRRCGTPSRRRRSGGSTRPEALER